MEPRSGWAPGAPALAEAARSISAVITQGRSLDAALSDGAGSAVRAIALGTARWYLRLAPAVERLLERPRGLAGPIHALLVTGAHQIEYSRNAPEATVDAAVDAARILALPRSSGLVNAVLRRFLRERVALLEAVDCDLAARTAHPRWLVAALQAAWAPQALQILSAGNEHPPMTLRVNLLKTAVEPYREQLTAAGLASTVLPWLPGAVVLERPVPVTELPGFKEGQVSVQDAGAQLAALLLDPQPGMRVLDACAAPGGKTAHLLERTRDLDLVAADIDAGRLGRIQENLDRLGAHTEQGSRVQLVAADVRELSGTFDRILVDAPCSATGVIRRHPDIKLLRRARDVPELAALQLEILRAAWRMLAPGGHLLYSTCSLLPAENEGVIQALLSEPAAQVKSLSRQGKLAPGAVDLPVGVQLLPGTEAGSDGFYYACLEKTTE